MCSKCLEAAKVYNNPLNPQIYADVDLDAEGKLLNSPKQMRDSGPTASERERYAPDPHRFAQNWREISKLTERAYEWADRAISYLPNGKLDDATFRSAVQKDPSFQKDDKLDKNIAAPLEGTLCGYPVTYQGVDWNGTPGVGKNGMTLARGGWFGEVS